MRTPTLTTRLAAMALAVFTASATPALAQKVASSPDDAPLSGTGSMQSMSGVGPLNATLYNFDVTGIFSNDGLGAAINERRTLNVGSNARITGLGWNVTLFADSPSWLSEMAVTFGSSSNTDIVRLRPGIGVNSPGTETFSSGGLVDLIGLGLDFSVDADGLLRMEFFETFVDWPGDWDGIWQSGLLTIEATTASSVPEPATLGLLALGLAAVAARRRRAAL